MLGDVAGATCSRSARAPASARAGCASTAARPYGLDLSARQLQHSRRLDEETGIAVPSVRGTATALPFADGCVRRGVLLLRRDAVRRRPRGGRRRGGPRAAARRPVRVLGHPPDPVELPRRPVRGRADRDVVVLGPHAVRRGGRRHRRAWPTSSTTARSATGSSLLAGHGFRIVAPASSRSGPRTTTGSGAAGRASAAGSPRGRRSSPPTWTSWARSPASRVRRGASSAGVPAAARRPIGGGCAASGTGRAGRPARRPRGPTIGTVLRISLSSCRWSSPRRRASAPGRR